MKIFMLGWEFPPFISGGLGTACYGLTRALNDLGHRVIFVLPQPIESEFTTHVDIRTPTTSRKALAAYRAFRLEEFQNVEFRSIPSELRPYRGPIGGGTEAFSTSGQRAVVSEVDRGSGPAGAGPGSETRSVLGSSGMGGGPGGHYQGDLFAEIERYAQVAYALALEEDFDLVHAHDWMTYRAGIAVSRATGKPLIVHVHSTEFDRSGEHVNQRIYDIEREGVHVADRSIAVSYYTRNILIHRYAGPADRIDVVYNAIDNNGGKIVVPPSIRKDEKIVLFLGRITMQKGPEYFLAAAKKVLEHVDRVRFVMAGSGDMIRRMIELAAELGIGHRVVFTGFLRGADVERIYRMADLYVMPSVSEPFGIAPLEALSNDVPVLISKQSGVSEVLTHVLKVDFWDVDEMANKIIAVLRHPPLQATLRHHGGFEVQKFTWRDAGRGCTNVYERALAARRG